MQSCVQCGSANAQALWTNPPAPGAFDASRKGHAHRIPLLPFTIDEDKGKPVDLARLRDRPLHTVVGLDEDGGGRSTIRIFTEHDASVAALRTSTEHHTDNDVGTSQSALRTAKLGLNLDLTIWRDINFGGCGWEFDGNTDISVLTNFDLAWACGFLWWGWQQLGTSGSSFMVAIHWPFFGFRDRGGSTIAWALNPPSGIGTDWSGLVLNLVPLGWNDRAISITLPGATYP
jgi:hypothetical protein